MRNLKKLCLPYWTVIISTVNDEEVKFLSEKFENKTTIKHLTDITKLNYNTVQKNLYLLRDKGYITFEKKGRNTLIKLTNKGRQVSFHLIKTRQAMQQ